MLTHCPRCKAPVIDQDRICSGCGLELDAIREEVTELMKPLEQRYADTPIKSVEMRRRLNAERAAAASVRKRRR